MRAATMALLWFVGGCVSEPEPSYLRVRGPAPAIHDAPATKALLVVFWASWCVPCREETPQILALARNPPADFSVVTFSHDAALAEAEEFLGGPPDPSLHLRLDPDRVTGLAFGVDTLPAAYLLIDGQLAARFNGPQQWNSTAMRRVLGRLVQSGNAKGG